MVFQLGKARNFLMNYYVQNIEDVETRTAIHLSVLQAFRENIRKVKAQLELNLARDIVRRDSTSMAVERSVFTDEWESQFGDR